MKSVNINLVYLWYLINVIVIKRFNVLLRIRELEIYVCCVKLGK